MIVAEDACIEKAVASAWVLAYVKAPFCVIIKAGFGKY